MDFWPPLRTQESRGVFPLLESLVARSPPHGARAVRHTPQRRRGRTVQRHRTTLCQSRAHHQLRRCWAGGRTHTAMGHAESWCHLSCGTTLDLLHDRRSHPRRFCPSAPPKRLSRALRSWTLPRHWRLAPGHECHPPLHPQIWRQQSPSRSATPLHWARANPHPRHDCGAATRDSKLPTRTLLGALHHLSRCHLHRPPRCGRR